MHNMDTENELQHKKSVTVTIRTNTSLKISALLAEICTTREVLIWQTGTFKVNILALSMRSCWLGRMCFLHLTEGFTLQRFRYRKQYTRQH